MSPAFMVCTASPDSGTSVTTVVSTCLMISSSVCPTPTVSTMTHGKPKASLSLTTLPVARADPVAEPAPAREGAGGVHGDDADGHARGGRERRQPIHQGGLPRPGGAG